VNAVAIVDEVVPEVLTPKVVNRGAATRTYPFGITAKPGSKTYQRLYMRSYRATLRAEKQNEVDTRRVAKEATQPKMAQYLTLGELSRSQSWPTDKESISQLRNRLRARERMLGVRLLFKVTKGPVPGGRYYTTIAHMRRHCPEMFDAENEAADLVKTLLDGVNKRLTEMQATIDRLRRRVKVLESRDFESACATR
jgi:hypothetical protein